MTISRRDLLTAFLGAPFAALACRERPPALPPGELVGTSHEVGHRLRGAPPPRPERWESHDVVIVGAGVAGLAAAWRLGGRPLVLELEPVIGGTSRSTATYPWGAHYVIAPSEQNRVLRRLLVEMGVMEAQGIIGEEFLCRDPEERVFYRGRWYEGLYLHAGASADDLGQLERFQSEVAKLAKTGAFVIPLAYSAADPDLDAIPMSDWLDARGFTSPRLRWLIDYACRDDYGTLLGHTSAWAALFYFASREERPVVTWPQGNGRPVGYLAQHANVRTNALVMSVTPIEDGVEVVTTRGGIRAKRVIVAAPQFVVSRLIPERPKTGFTYGSWMVANLALRDRPVSRGYPPAWDNVLYESPSLGYVTATHQSGIDHGPTVLTYYYPLCDADPHAARTRLLFAGRDEWAEIALADLSRAHPDLRPLTTRIDVMRWGHAMIRPTPGAIWSDARRRAAQPWRGIHFANTDLSGVALFEEALYHGVRAAEEVLGDRAGATWL